MKIKCIYNSGIAQLEDNKEWIEVKNGLAGSLTIGKVYEVLEIEGSDYRIVDDEGEDYLYPTSFFEIVQTTHLERHFMEKSTET